MNTIGGVEVSNLTVQFDSGGYALRPLDDFSFSAPSGTLTLLLGPSGCGKTTLLSCLAGLLQPTSGTLTYDDVDVTALRGRELADFRQRTVGIVFQAFNLVPSLSALENVAVPMWTAGWRLRRARERATELLEQVGLGDRIGHRPSQLSGGQQQRVAIARALALDPPVLLADEPTAHLDHVQVEGILRVLRSLSTPGRLVIVATHDDRLVPLADQLVPLTKQQEHYSEGAVRIELEAGSELFAEGDASGRIYVVETGVIELHRERSDGSKDHVRTVNAGDYFGEMGPLFSLPRSATATAAAHTVVSGYTVRRFSEHIGVDKLPDLLRSHAVPTPKRRAASSRRARTSTPRPRP